MKFFEMPAIEVISFAAENIMAASAGGNACELDCQSDTSCGSATAWG